MKSLDAKNRLYSSEKYIIGLTGSIATGKSSAANFLKDQGHPVIDADSLVKKIYSKKATIDFITNNYPAVIENDQINFNKLRDLFFSNADVKISVEKFIYQQLEDEFNNLQLSISKPYLIYDVPLLFEKGLDKKVDATIVVACDEKEQLKRLIKRDQIQEELAVKMISSQISISKKSKLADFTIDNSKDLEHLKQEVTKVMKSVLACLELGSD